VSRRFARLRTPRARGRKRGYDGRMSEYALPRDDEPFDFRRQASVYARFRRDYSPAVYDTIAARTGPAGGRIAIDLGCGTGFVTGSLAARGWRAIGVDLSAPMLAAAREATPDAALVRARGEALPVRAGAAALVTAGTAFHWMAPAPTLAEVGRVLVPGGWVAVFWRVSRPSSPAMRVVATVLARRGVVLPDGLGPHAASASLDGSDLVTEPAIRFESSAHFTPETLTGFVSTVEWVRRIAGPAHAPFLDDLRAELDRSHPDGIEDRVEETLLLGRRAD
jgi:trans-aconitate methyltransferase